MILSKKQCELYTRGGQYIPDDLLDTITALRTELKTVMSAKVIKASEPRFTEEDALAEGENT